MPKFEANMNCIPPRPPSSMKQGNKSATVKFHMELLLTTMTRKQSRSGATPESEIVRVVSLSIMEISEITRLKVRSLGSRNCHEYKPRAWDWGKGSTTTVPTCFQMCLNCTWKILIRSLIKKDTVEKARMI